VTEHGVPMRNAMRITKATCRPSSLYHKSALCIAAKKIHARYLGRKNYKTRGMEDESSDDDDGEEEDAGKERKKKGKRVYNVGFSNLDLGNLVNGWPDDPIEDCPFDLHFSAKGII
jgi:hypothetical protein